MLGQGAANPGSAATGTTEGAKHQRNAMMSTWVCLKIGYLPNEIAIQKRDNDQQNHWVHWGTLHFQTHPHVYQGAYFQHLAKKEWQV